MEFAVLPNTKVPADADEPTTSAGLGLPRMMHNDVLDGLLPGNVGRPAGSQHRDHLETSVYDVGRIAYAASHMGQAGGLFYRVTGYEPALELARGLVYWALKRIYNREDGQYTIGHFHAGTRGLISVCEYALAAGDREVLERADACFRWVRHMGDPLVGFYAEFMPGSENFLTRQGNTAEICEISNMVWLALFLTRHGMGDYWDDVDRWVRNMYTQGQMCHAHFLENIPDQYFLDGPVTKPHMCTEHVTKDAVGSFFGWMRANDGLAVEQTEYGPKLFVNSIMHCCTANGARTLSLVWQSIVTKDGDTVNVNLLLNRASTWLDVDSHLPVEGKVVLHIKDAPIVSVRIPQWAEPADVKVTVGGQPRRAVAQGRFLKIRWLKPGDEVVLQMSVPQRSIPRVIGEMPYKLEIRGSNVVDIEPKGIGYPLYANQPTGKLISKTRFIPKIRDLIW